MPNAARPAPDDRCDETPGRLRPVVDRDRCEGKEACVEACPYDVFTMGTLTSDERRAQSWLGWFKSLAHGWRQAYAVRADQCRACGLCVEACPEKAIKLARA